jgi:hypothetical protein
MLIISLFLELKANNQSFNLETFACRKLYSSSLITLATPNSPIILPEASFIGYFLATFISSLKIAFSSLK